MAMKKASKKVSKKAEPKTKSSIREVIIPEPNIQTLVFKIQGTAPLVQHKFSKKAREAIMATHREGSTGRSKRKREARDFEKDYREAMHISEDGWNGIPAASFRSAMIDACRLVGFKMTHAKLAIFVKQDGLDIDEGTPLIRILTGKPEQHVGHVRNETGVVDIRSRPMWRKWSARLVIDYDADVFQAQDIANLLARAGAQVGVGEGRPNSKKSHGMGWGTFEIV